MTAPMWEGITSMLTSLHMLKHLEERGHLEASHWKSYLATAHDMGTWVRQSLNFMEAFDWIRRTSVCIYIYL